MTTREAAFSFAALQEHYRAPQPLYDALRAFDPIYYDRSSRCWLITGRAAVTHILGDARFESRPPGGRLAGAVGAPQQDMPSVSELLGHQMLFFTDAVHQRAYSVVSRCLNELLAAKQTQRLITDTVDGVLSNTVGRVGVDMVSEVARPIAAATSAALIGMPTGDSAQLAQWTHWSNAFADRTSGFSQAPAVPIYRMQHAFLQLISDRRKSQAGGDTSPPAHSRDLLDALLSDPDSFPNDQLLASNLQMLFGAGRVTAEKAMAEGVRQLLHEPKHWQALRAEVPGNPQVARRLADEVLRVVTPTRFVKRWAQQDVDLSGSFPGNHLVRRGSEVVLYLEAANRDPAGFANPGCFDPWRQPNRHLAFGYGSHLCPGAGIARLELRLFFEALLQGCPRPTLVDGGEPRYNPNPNLGGVQSYLLNFS